MVTAIIGGSGLQTLPGFQIAEHLSPDTPWGPTSAPVLRGTLDGMEAYFLPRHGGARAIPPHLVNYRANIAALAALGVDRILAFNAVGGIGTSFPPGLLVVPHQLIDYTWGRPSSYWDGPDQQPLHIDFTSPYDSATRISLIRAAESEGVPVRPWGVYGATQGPRLETAAEIRRLHRDGCDLVGMTGMPEAALAREKGIAYACLALVVNPAAGTVSGVIDLQDIQRIMDAALPGGVRLLARALAAAP